MIYDMRTYTLRPRGVPEFAKRLADALPYREQFSRFGAIFETTVGTLNQVVHFWLYENMAHAEEVRAKLIADGDPRWPVDGRDIVLEMESAILEPAPFMREWDGPMELGSVYELRTYHLLPGSRGEVLKAWGDLIAEREKFSPSAGVWTHSGTAGPQNRLYHLWPYKDMNERGTVREKAMASGNWPPKSGHLYTRQESKFLVPLSISPLR